MAFSIYIFQKYFYFKFQGITYGYYRYYKLKAGFQNMWNSYTYSSHTHTQAYAHCLDEEVHKWNNKDTTNHFVCVRARARVLCALRRKVSEWISTIFKSVLKGFVCISKNGEEHPKSESQYIFE